MAHMVHLFGRSDKVALAVASGIGREDPLQLPAWRSGCHSWVVLKTIGFSFVH